jgi:hypothetical protein
MDRKQLMWLSLVVVLLLAFAPQLALSKHKDTRPGCQPPCAVPDCPCNVSTNGGEDEANPAFKAGYEGGYKLGFDHGKGDFASCVKYDNDESSDYKNPTGWCKDMGSRKSFNRGWRRGFKIGYEDGYAGRVSQFAVIPAAIPAPAPAPLPAPAPIPQVSLPPVQQETPTTVEVQPTAAPVETVITTTAPIVHKRLPRTASSLPLFGLVGIGAVSVSFLVQLGNKMI